MSKTDQFRQYADEAIRWAFQSKTDEHIFGGNDNPPEARAL